MKKLSCAEATQIDLVDYLGSLGHQPQKIRNQDYWYISPLREEKTASFKVNRIKRIWFDYGCGQGGDIIDFGVLYYKCSVSELLVRLLESNTTQPLSFHLQTFSVPPMINEAGEKEGDPMNKIVVAAVRPLTSVSLLNYLERRSIPPGIAMHFCKEVDFVLYGKKQTAIGFPNDSGGYELRNQNYKGSSSPKASTFIDNKSTSILVFEGFFDLLSYQAIHLNKDLSLANILVLNSLAFFEKQRIKMEPHMEVHLFLDRDSVGRKCTENAQKTSSKYIDESKLYNNCKDLNEWLIQTRRSCLLYENMKRGPVNNQIKTNHHGRI